MLCAYGKDVQYVPSRWENEWRAKMETLYREQRICEEMLTHVDWTATWMRHVNDPEAHQTGTADQDVFSYFQRQCIQASGAVVQVKEFIEPLVGHMRHPQQFCKFDALSEKIRGRSSTHMLALPPNAADIFPGRKYLFDAGTKDFNSSLAWLINRYKQVGLEFDEIFAWEAKPADAAQYWKSVSPDIGHRLHFYNAFMDADKGSQMNPLEVMRRIYQAGDFIVFKLDIDNDPLEDRIIQTIKTDPSVSAMIAEMFFEKHYNSKESDRFFGHPETTYPDAVKQLADLRASGLRIHYWH